MQIAGADSCRCYRPAGHRRTSLVGGGGDDAVMHFYSFIIYRITIGLTSHHSAVGEIFSIGKYILQRIYGQRGMHRKYIMWI
jgi:hypothetical protein